MKKFLAIYLATDSKRVKWDSLDAKIKEEKEVAGMAGWMKWADTHSKSITDLGSPLGKTKLVNSNGISDTKNSLTAYTIVEAESPEAAAKMFLNHPHFMIFPGESVEIVECLPMPKM